MYREIQSVQFIQGITKLLTSFKEPKNGLVVENKIKKQLDVR